MEHTTVFVVSGDAAIRDSAGELIGPEVLRVETFASLDAWLAAVPPERPGCLVLDARVRDLTGAERLASFAAVCASRPVLLLIDRGDVPIAVQALKRGAFDVVEKPCRGEDLLAKLQRVAALRT